jgi:HD-GYP domain-containing protein (c-di-GMP phosphodiesterase class II)
VRLGRRANPTVQGVNSGTPAKAFSVILQEEFGVPFSCYDAETGAPLSGPESATVRPMMRELDRSVVRALASGEAVQLTYNPAGLFQAVLIFREHGCSGIVALGLLPALGGAPSKIAQEQARLSKWVHTFQDRLRLTKQLVERRRNGEREESRTAVAWEALLTIGQLLPRLRIHKEPVKNAKRILQAAYGLLQVQSLVWVPLPHAVPVQSEGETLLAEGDCRQLTVLLAQEAEVQKGGLLLCNQMEGYTWAGRYPQITSLLALPINMPGRGGWLLALNKQPAVSHRVHEAGKPPSPDRPPFRRGDAALLLPFAALLDLHGRAATRYSDLKALLVGLTRSLTAAIDAKDSYTYGHSERVARIAVELGCELELQEEELSDIYLAGLLHDIGKIGIRDDVLAKTEPLTPDEFEHIKQHVIIGYRIVADLRPLRSLLPGVRHHHERYDGGGYPDRLAGDAIPLLARILAVADAYDAMSTPRPYRGALAADRVEETLLQGAGTQWDGRVIEAFLRCKDKVRLIRERGVGESLGHALDGALRNDRSSRRGLSASLAAGSSHVA